MAVEKRVTLLEIDVDNTLVIKKQGDVLKQIEELKKANKDLKKDTDNLTGATDDQAQTYAKNQGQIKKLQQESRTYTKIIQNQVKASDSNLKIINKTDGSINSLRNALNINKGVYKSLTKEERENSKVGGDLLKLINKQDDEYKKLSRSIGNTQVDVGNYGKALGGLKSKITGLLSIAGIAGLIKGIFNLNGELRKLDRTTRTLFDGTQEEIRAITIEARGLASAFDLDVNETLKSANVLAKQFGLDGAQALALIEEGASKGANANGELLSNISEYSTQFRLAGLSASESIAIIQQQVKSGVFSDKGVDAIKEATLSLRELTPNAIKALEAIGISSDQVQKDISSGAKTYFDVIQEVANKTREFGEDSTEAGLILADVFKGAGEDAGDFIFKLGDINTNLGDIKTTLTEQDQVQIELSKSWNEFTSDVANGGGIIGKALTKIKKIANGALQGFLRLQRSYSSQALLDIESLADQRVDEFAKKYKDYLSTISEDDKRTRKQINEDVLKGYKDNFKRAKFLLKLQGEERLLAAKRLGLNLDKIEDDNLKKTIAKYIAGQKAIIKVNQEELKATDPIDPVDPVKPSINPVKRDAERLESYKQTLDEQLGAITEFNANEIIQEENKQSVLGEIFKRVDEEKKVKKITEFQDNILRLQSEGATELEVRMAQLALEKEQELQVANEIGADKAKIDEKYARQEVQIRREIENQKLGFISETLQGASSLFAENTAAYKLTASAQTLIDTYLGAQKAYVSQIIPGEPSSVVRATLAAAIATASGLANVARINDVAGFADGTTNAQPYGVVDLSSHTGTISGTPNISRSNGDNMLATVKTGEAILNERQQNKLSNLLGFDAVRYAVNGYADGTTFTSPTITNNINRNIVNNSNLNSGISDTNINLQVDVKDIAKGLNDYQTKVNDASI